MWRHFLLSSSINKTGLKYLTSKKGLMTTLGCLLKGLLILEKVVELTAQSVLFALLNNIFYPQMKLMRIYVYHVSSTYYEIFTSMFV